MGEGRSPTLLPALGTLPSYRVASSCLNRRGGASSSYNLIGHGWLIYTGGPPFPEEKGGGVNGVEQEGRLWGKD